jgi:hypothetical protein
MKRLFFSLQARERYMAIAALTIGAIIGSTTAWSHVHSQWDMWRALENENAVQLTWLKNEPAIRTAAANAIRGLDAGRGYDQAKLVAETLAAAKDVGLNAVSEAPKTQKAGRFSIHTMQMSCRRTDITSVVKFYESIQPRAPYLSISSISLQSDRGNSGTVSMTVQMSAIELIGAK